MRRAAKVDANQVEIVAALERAGATVLHLHMVGRGCPDLAVGYQSRTYLLECKAGRGMLTRDEQAFFAGWRGHVTAVYSAEDALHAIGAT